MHNSKNGLRTLACAALMLGSTACQDWVQAVLTRNGGGEQPPAADDADPAPDSGDPTKAVLPAAPARCPEIKTGETEFKGIGVQLWVGDEKPEAKRPVVIYWHGTGSSTAEVKQLLHGTFDDILAEGGIIAALTETTEEGQFTSTATWYSGDFDVVDELIGCLAADSNIDPQRIYTAGCDSGGVHAGAFAYARSNYVAGAMLNSGGLVQRFALQGEDRVPAIITAHGAQGYDVVIIDFADASLALDIDLVSRGGFAVDCDHGRNHCEASPELVKAQWQFLKDHPYGVDPEPYSDQLPEGFPSYCRVIQ